MTTYYAQGSPQTDLTRDDLRAALVETLRRLEPRRKVLALPPDFTRANSMAGPLTCMAYEYFGDRLVDVMPALGTHVAMPDWQLDRMFPGVPKRLFRVHDWRNDVVTIGEVPAEFVAEATEGIWRKPWPAQLNRLVWEGGHDLILSIGQVVPHEVIGMANYNKNLFVGTGGAAGINESHFIGAAYGMERMMGRADTPLAAHPELRPGPFLPPSAAGVRADRDRPARRRQPGRARPVHRRRRGVLRAGGRAVGRRSTSRSSTSRRKKVVVYLDPEEFHSTWLGNKAIYRTRMAIADGGELVVLAPGVGTFGEDPEIDRLIRKYGYRTTPEIMRFVEQTDDLPQESLGGRPPDPRLVGRAVHDHLLPGQAQPRGDRVGRLSLRRPGGDARSATIPKTLRDGWNTLPDGERIYYISNPALGLWAYRGDWLEAVRPYD